MKSSISNERKAVLPGSPKIIGECRLTQSERESARNRGTRSHPQAKVIFLYTQHLERPSSLGGDIRDDGFFAPANFLSDTTYECGAGWVASKSLT